MPCFTPGTLIATPFGERRIETLAAGDRIVTRDNGMQELRWVGSAKLDYARLVAEPHLRPVLLSAGGLGEARPESDMLVSPNTRVLVGAERTALELEDHEALVAAKHLVNSRDIRVVEMLGVTYIAMVCSRHEVVMANGIWVEACNPADFSLNGLGNAQRNELDALFPGMIEELPVVARAAARSRLRRLGLSFLPH